ncbi:hypothetical protein Tco_0167643 [Tanacetum coccineum]
MMTGTKFDIEKFDGKNDFALWQGTSEDDRSKGEGEVNGCIERESGLRDMEQVKIGVVKVTGFVRSEDQVSGSGDDGCGDGSGKAVYRDKKGKWYRWMDGSSWYVPELRRNLISLGTLKKRGFYREDTFGQDQGYKGFTGGIIRNKKSYLRIYLERSGSDQEDIEGSTQQCTKSVVAKHLGVAVIQEQNGLVKETNVTFLAKQGCIEPVKVKCIFLGYRKGIVGNKLWRSDDITSKVVLYRNMSFNESGEYKKTFISSSVGTSSVQVLQGVEFEYYSARDREQHLAWELFNYREDSNEAVFAVAAVGKIYAHESLTFNNTFACEEMAMNDIDVYYGSIHQEYQMVCTRPDITSADVGMLDGFDRGLQTDAELGLPDDVVPQRQSQLEVPELEHAVK